MILYGRNPLHEALRGRRAKQLVDIWATAAAAREPWLAKHSVRICSAEEIERRCASSGHQGLCAYAGPYPYVEASDLLELTEPLIVVLDQVQDPQNLGSICRTAECAGASGVVIAEHRSANVTPAVCKASAGAVEHLRIARVRNVAGFLIAARDAGCWSYGACAPAAGAGTAATERDVATERDTATERDAVMERDVAAKRGAAAERAGRALRRRSDAVSQTVPYTAPDYRGGGVVLVLGSEGCGLRPRVASTCDQLISLPLRGQIESLGVAAAAAALLYGILQARTIA